MESQNMDNHNSLDSHNMQIPNMLYLKEDH